MSLGASAVNVAEQDPLVETEEYEMEPYDALESQAQEMPEDSTRDDGALHVLEEEIEVLASELEAAAQEGCDGAELGSLEEQLDGAVEALVTLREARAQIAGPPGKKKAGQCHACGREGHYRGSSRGGECH